MSALNETIQADESVSLIVPVYNTEKYLQNCVDSLLAQTYAKIEIILVDDGSTDESPRICDRYASEHSHVRVIHKSNGGLSDARNVGMCSVTNKYLMFVDSDDCVDKYMVAICMATIQRYNADIVGFSYQCFDSAVPTAHIKNKSATKKNQKIMPYYLADNHLYSVCRYIWKKDIIETNSIAFDTNTKLGEDQLFVYEYVKHCKLSVTITYDGYFYRYNPLSLSSGVVKENHYDDIRNRKYIYSDCSQKNKRLAKVHLLKGYLAYCLKAMLYGTTCKQNIVAQYRKTIKKNIILIIFSAHMGLKRKIASLLLCLSPRATKYFLRGRIL